MKNCENDCGGRLPPSSDFNADECGLGSDIENDTSGWMEADTDDPSHQILDDDETVADMTSGANDEN